MIAITGTVYSAPTATVTTPTVGCPGPATDAARSYAWVMAIIGTHALLYTSEPEALRAVFRDVFGLDNVDAHDGWLIFALPPAELGIHPADAPAHQLTFMCDDIRATMAELRTKGIAFKGEPEDQGFGVVATMVLPGDVEMMLYQPKHKTAI